MKSEVKLNSIQEKPRTYPCLVLTKGGVVWMAFSPKKGLRLSTTIDSKLSGVPMNGAFDVLPLFEGSITLTND